MLGSRSDVQPGGALPILVMPPILFWLGDGPPHGPSRPPLEAALLRRRRWARRRQARRAVFWLVTARLTRGHGRPSSRAPETPALGAPPSSAAGGVFSARLRAVTAPLSRAPETPRCEPSTSAARFPGLNSPVASRLLSDCGHRTTLQPRACFRGGLRFARLPSESNPLGPSVWMAGGTAWRSRPSTLICSSTATARTRWRSTRRRSKRRSCGSCGSRTARAACSRASPTA